MAKSADAFRTISEVADWLETPAHVLRFWESKFSQVKPVKRAGGRRYYRPADMKLLGGIKKLLHDDGMTIKGVQKMLREQGVGHVSDFSQPLGDAADDVIIDHVEEAPAAASEAQHPGAGAASEPQPSDAGFRTPIAPQTPQAEAPTPSDVSSAAEVGPEDAGRTPEPPSSGATPDPEPRTPSAAPEPPPVASDLPPRPEMTNDRAPPPTPEREEETESAALTFSRHKPEPAPLPEVEPDPTAETQDVSDDGAQLPSFLQRNEAPLGASQSNEDQAQDPQVADDTPETPKPSLAVGVPDDPEDEVDADAGVLTLLSRIQRPLSPDTIAGLEGLIPRLRATTGTAARE